MPCCCPQLDAASWSLMLQLGAYLHKCASIYANVSEGGNTHRHPCVLAYSCLPLTLCNLSPDGPAPDAGFTGNRCL